MRPFKVPLNNTWIDLDTIQSIKEPVLVSRIGSGGLFIEMCLTYAFRDTEQILNWYQDYNYEPGWQTEVPSPALTNGEPSMLVKVRKEVFIPLFEAWSGTKYIQPQPVT